MRMEKWCINFLMLIFIISCISLASSVSAHRNGTATYYTAPYVPSACNGFHRMGTMIAVASDEIWDDGDACGRRYKVSCKSIAYGGPWRCRHNSVVVRITDYCPPESCHGTIDLSQEAFAMIADPEAGIVRVSFNEE